jgi:hypothetical protein
MLCFTLLQVRKTIIHMILATDNEMHFEHLAKVTAAQNAAEAAAGLHAIATLLLMDSR